MAEKPSVTSMQLEEQTRHAEQMFLDGVIGTGTLKHNLRRLGFGDEVVELAHSRLYSMRKRKHGRRYDDRD